MSRIAIIGGGAWGTALAMVAGRRGDHRSAAVGAGKRSGQLNYPVQSE